MQHRRNLLIPDTLADVCDPDRIALIVYDMQVGVVGQLAHGRQVTERVRQVLEAARRAAVRVFFTRHMTLPAELMGVSQLRTATAWQRKHRVEDVVSPFLRHSPSFQLVPELAPRESEAVFDKRAGDRVRDRRRRDGSGARAHRPARRRPGPDSGRGHRRLRSRQPGRRQALP